MKIIEHLKELRAKATENMRSGFLDDRDFDSYNEMSETDRKLCAAAINALPALLEVAEAAIQTVEDAAHVADPYGGADIGKIEDALANLRKVSPQ